MGYLGKKARTQVISDIASGIKDAVNAKLNFTGLGTQVTETPITQIDVNASNPANTGSIRLLTTGTVDEFTGDFDAVSQFTDESASYKIETNGNSGDKIAVISAEEGRYVPGYEAIAATSFNTQDPLDDSHKIQVGYGIFDESNVEVKDGFYVELTASEKKLVLKRGGQVAATVRDLDWRSNPYEAGKLDEFTPTIFRQFFNWYGAGAIKPIFSYTDDDGYQQNDVADRLFDNSDYLTDEINLHMFTKIECVSDTDTGLSVNSGSMEYKNRGQGEGTDRSKFSHEFNVTGGNIDGSLTGVKVLRIDPAVVSVDCQFLGLEATPDADMQVAAIGVDKSQLTLSDSDFGTPNLLSSTNNIIQEAPYSAIDQSEIPANVDDMNGARQLSGVATVSGSNKAQQNTGSDVKQFFTRFEYVVFVAKTDGSSGADLHMGYDVSEGY